jgi:hypothetical protein|tara:strand:+ start:1787 stop:2014 length:228 start_codon:yes stop_codon:yes gene_type:complete
VRKPTNLASNIRGQVTTINPHRAKPYQNESVLSVSSTTCAQNSAQDIQYEQFSAQNKLQEKLMSSILHNKSSRTF